jgi:hypothetical protein
MAMFRSDHQADGSERHDPRFYFNPPDFTLELILSTWFPASTASQLVGCWIGLRTVHCVVVFKFQILLGRKAAIVET